MSRLFIKGLFPSFHRGIFIFVLRIFLGGVFLYASLHKINNAAQFKEAVANYEILPYYAVNITAITLPWLEFWTGILLIGGILVRACAILKCSLLTMFNVAIGITIGRGVQIDCGCFSEGALSSVTNSGHIVLNTGWLLLGVVLFILERRRFSHRFFLNYSVPR